MTTPRRIPDSLLRQVAPESAQARIPFRKRLAKHPSLSLSYARHIRNRNHVHSIPQFSLNAPPKAQHFPSSPHPHHCSFLSAPDPARLCCPRHKPNPPPPAIINPGGAISLTLWPASAETKTSTGELTRLGEKQMWEIVAISGGALGGGLIGLIGRRACGTGG